VVLTLWLGVTRTVTTLVAWCCDRLTSHCHSSTTSKLQLTKLDNLNHIEKLFEFIAIHEIIKFYSCWIDWYFFTPTKYFVLESWKRSQSNINAKVNLGSIVCLFFFQNFKNGIPNVKIKLYVIHMYSISCIKVQYKIRYTLGDTNKDKYWTIIHLIADIVKGGMMSSCMHASCSTFWSSRI
jgi:hypothetical protein